MLAEILDHTGSKLFNEAILQGKTTPLVHPNSIGHHNQPQESQHQPCGLGQQGMVTQVQTPTRPMDFSSHHSIPLVCYIWHNNMRSPHPPNNKFSHKHTTLVPPIIYTSPSNKQPTNLIPPNNAQNSTQWVQGSVSHYPTCKPLPNQDNISLNLNSKIQRLLPDYAPKLWCHFHMQPGTHERI